MLAIRNEQARDYEAVEALTRRAFYNVYRPGCTEHYLVRQMRAHDDFLPELAFVAELDGQVIGSILYTRAYLTDEQGTRKEILTFGPLSVDPAQQRKGYGKRLMQTSFQRALALGYDTVVIMGDPANYVTSGFRSSKKYNVCLPGDLFPAALLLKELRSGALDGRRWVYSYSPVMDVDERAAQAYDDSLPPLPKAYRPSQEAFDIISHSVLVDA